MQIAPSIHRIGDNSIVEQAVVMQGSEVGADCVIRYLADSSAIWRACGLLGITSSSTPARVSQSSFSVNAP
jgi:hypothetical protein